MVIPIKNSNFVIKYGKIYNKNTNNKIKLDKER